MDRAALRDGLRDIAPALPPNAVFGMLFGATAVDVGVSPLQAAALSLFTFAATAQVAAVELLRDGAALPVVLATVLVINLRYVVFSASLAGQVRDLPRRWRAVIAYPLMDLTYALAAARYGDDSDSDDSAADGPAATADASGRDGAGGGHRGWYYVGVAAPLVGLLVAGTAAGALAGRTFGRGLDLEFAIPLIFVGLLVPDLDGRPGVAAALVAAAVAAVAAGLPFNAGLLLGIAAGTAAAAAVDGRDGGWLP